MKKVTFKDCEYRYLGNNDKLYCKNKPISFLKFIKKSDEICSNDKLKEDSLCDNCKLNVHLNCDNYVSGNDMCLKYFELGISEVSQYDDCAEKTIYNDKELSKWSN